MNQSILSRRMVELECHALHSIWIEIQAVNFTALLCCFYRPPSATVSFWDNFEVSIDKALDVNSNLIMVGDINEDQLQNFTRLKQALALFNLRNTITNATRVTANTSTLLDPIVVSNNLNVLDSEIIPVCSSISDHHATAVHIKVESVISKPTKRHVWLYKRADFNRLNALIDCENWNFINHTSIDEATLLFTNKLLELMKLSIPFKLVTVRPNDKPWYDSMKRSFT